MSDEVKNEFDNENEQGNFSEQNSEPKPAPIDPEFFILEGPFLNESVVSAELSNLRKICESVLNVVNSYLPENQQNNSKNLEMVANCQKQTAEIANAMIERHALNPAIETVFILTNLIHQLAEKTKSSTEQHTTCHLFKPILNSISETVKIANDKCEYLGIEKISPDELDDFNAKEHEIKQPVTTEDSNKHKKIHQTLIPGLMYRGKVLKFAQVSVYCFKN